MSTSINGTTGISANMARFLIGQVCFFGMTTPPSGFLKCNGAAISRITYDLLFSAIGTTYGVGDGSTTFNLPETRGEFLRCLDDSRGIDTSRVLGSAQGDLVKTHTHPLTVAESGSLFGNGTTASLGSGTGIGGLVSASAAATGGAENRPRNIAFLACIFSGV